MQNPIAVPYKALQEILQKACAAAAEKGLLPADSLPHFTVEQPADPANGDFAANAALVSAKAFRMPPRKIAEILAENADLSGSFFARLEVAGPGFLNGFLSPEWYSRVLATVEEMGDRYGRTDYGAGRKVMVEFVSANPTGPMHIGNARGGAIGDCLAAALDWSGHQVSREFYVNDAGNQIEKFAVSLARRYQQHYRGEDAVEFPAEGYQGEDIKVLARAFAEEVGDRYLEDEDALKKAIVEYALPRNVEGLRRDLERYRITYDTWFYESTLHDSGAVMEAIRVLTERGFTYEQDGVVYLRSTQFGSDKDDVLIRSNGIPTYFAADIAYHYNKFAVRGFDEVINVWGADHHGHVARLKGAMDAMGLSGDRLTIVLMQLVKLVRDGEIVKVSKRTGKSITLLNLLEEVDINAARFFFNLREANSQMDFDLDLAAEETSKNPVFYVQYAHARICSILRNLAAEGLSPLPSAQCDLTLLSSPEELALIRQVAALPAQIIDAARDYDPALLTRYSIDLATAFHRFYNSCRVKTEDAALSAARLRLCVSVKTALHNCLTLLKIDAPESM